MSVIHNMIGDILVILDQYGRQSIVKIRTELIIKESMRKIEEDLVETKFSLRRSISQIVNKLVWGNGNDRIERWTHVILNLLCENGLASSWPEQQYAITMYGQKVLKYWWR